MDLEAVVLEVVQVEIVVVDIGNGGGGDGDGADVGGVGIIDYAMTCQDVMVVMVVLGHS